MNTHDTTLNPEPSRDSTTTSSGGTPTSTEVDTLQEVGQRLRTAIIDSAGYDPALERPHAWHAPALTGELASTIFHFLTATSRALKTQAAHMNKLHETVSRLRSSNGALMVDRDRDRSIAAALTRAAGTELLAREIATKAGVELDIPAEATARNRDRDEQLCSLEQRIERLERGRVGMVNTLNSLGHLHKAGTGLTPEQLGKVVRALDRANNHATGRR